MEYRSRNEAAEGMRDGIVSRGFHVDFGRNGGQIREQRTATTDDDRRDALRARRGFLEIRRVTLPRRRG